MNVNSQNLLEKYKYYKLQNNLLRKQNIPNRNKSPPLSMSIPHKFQNFQTEEDLSKNSGHIFNLVTEESIYKNNNEFINNNEKYISLPKIKKQSNIFDIKLSKEKENEIDNQSIQRSIEIQIKKSKVNNNNNNNILNPYDKCYLFISENKSYEINSFNNKQSNNNFKIINDKKIYNSKNTNSFNNVMIHVINEGNKKSIKSDIVKNRNNNNLDLYNNNNFKITTYTKKVKGNSNHNIQKLLNNDENIKIDNKFEEKFKSLKKIGEINPSQNNINSLTKEDEVKNINNEELQLSLNKNQKNVENIENDIKKDLLNNNSNSIQEIFINSNSNLGSLNRSLDEINSNIDSLYKSLDIVQNNLIENLNNSKIMEKNFLDGIKNEERKNSLKIAMDRYNRFKSYGKLDKKKDLNAPPVNWTLRDEIDKGINNNKNNKIEIKELYINNDLNNDNKNNNNNNENDNKNDQEQKEKKDNEEDVNQNDNENENEFSFNSELKKFEQKNNLEKISKQQKDNNNQNKENGYENSNNTNEIHEIQYGNIFEKENNKEDNKEYIKEDNKENNKEYIKEDNKEDMDNIFIVQEVKSEIDKEIFDNDRENKIRLIKQETNSSNENTEKYKDEAIMNKNENINNSSNIINNSINININNNDNINKSDMKDHNEYLNINNIKYKQNLKPGFFIRKVVREEHYYVDENGKEKILQVKQEYINNEDKKRMKMKNPYKKKYVNLGTFFNMNNTSLHSIHIKDKDNEESASNINTNQNQNINTQEINDNFFENKNISNEDKYGNNKRDALSKKITEKRPEPILTRPSEFYKCLNNVIYNDNSDNINNTYFSHNSFFNQYPTQENNNFNTLENSYIHKKNKINYHIKENNSNTSMNLDQKQNKINDKPNPIIINRTKFFGNKMQLTEPTTDYYCPTKLKKNINIKYSNNIKKAMNSINAFDSYIKVNKVDKYKRMKTEHNIKKSNTISNMYNMNNMNNMNNNTLNNTTVNNKRKRESSKNHAYHEIKTTNTNSSSKNKMKKYKISTSSLGNLNRINANEELYMSNRINKISMNSNISDRYNNKKYSTNNLGQDKKRLNINIDNGYNREINFSNKSSSSSLFLNYNNERGKNEFNNSNKGNHQFFESKSTKKDKKFNEIFDKKRNSNANDNIKREKYFYSYYDIINNQEEKNNRRNTQKYH